MAASGQAEHMEARRKEHVIQRKAFLAREAKRALNAEDFSDPLRGSTTYDRQIYGQSKQGVLPSHDAVTMDMQRRMDLYNQSRQEYSAKLNNRYNVFDYTSQW